MNTFFEFWQKMKQDKLSVSISEQEASPDEAARRAAEREEEIRKRFSKIAATPKATEDPAEYRVRKKFNQYGLMDPLRNVLNDEVNHRIHEFAKIVSRLGSSEDVEKWVGREKKKSKLPFDVNIDGKKVSFTPELLKEECESYVNIGKDFIGDIARSGSIDFAELMFQNMGRDNEALSNLISGSYRAKRFKTLGKSEVSGEDERFSYTSHHPQLKGIVKDNPLSSAFDTGAIDKVIMMTIYMRNRNIDEKQGESRWMKAFRWVSMNVFSKMNKKDAESMDKDAGESGMTLASQMPDTKTSREQPSKTNRAVQLGTMIIKLKEIIRTELPEILSSPGSDVANIIGQDVTSRFNLRPDDMSYRGLVVQLTNKDEGVTLRSDKQAFMQASGVRFLVNLFDKLATKMITIDPDLIRNLLSKSLLEIVINEIMPPAESEILRLGNQPRSKATYQNLAHLFVMLMAKAELEVSKEALPGDEGWGSITSRLYALPAGTVARLRARDTTLSRTQQDRGRHKAMKGFWSGTEPFGKMPQRKPKRGG